MVHLRARNLPVKGKVVEWLFNNNNISFGDDFARIQLDDGNTVIVKSNYNGLIIKTIKLNTQVKNGSILANIIIEENEIKEFIKQNQARANLEKNINQDTSTQDVNIDTNKNTTTINPGDQKSKFAQMRENIKNSLKSSPILNEQTNQQLDNDNIDMNTDGENIFANRNGEGTSKFRELVNSRKQKLFKENNFKQIEDAQVFDAMSKLDEKGRPLIMRNIIASRLEKYNNGEKLDNEKNDMNIEKKEEHQIMGDQEDSINKFINVRTNSNNSLTEEETETHRGFVIPRRDTDKLINEINNKSNKTYADKKISALYDPSRRSEVLLNNGNKTNSITARRKALEAELKSPQENFVNDDHFRKDNIPAEFLKVIPQQDRNGQIQYIPYNQTQEGHEKYLKWIENNKTTSEPEFDNQELLNLFKKQEQNNKNIDIFNQKNPTTFNEKFNVPFDWDAQNQTPKQIQNQLDEQINKKITELKDLAGADVASKTIDLLKTQINALQNSLEKQNQLNEATQRLNASAALPNNYGAGAGIDTFSQMMQYILMQNITQNMSGNKNPNDDIKDIIRREINDFKNDLKPHNQFQYTCSGPQCKADHTHRHCNCRIDYLYPECNLHQNFNNQNRAPNNNANMKVDYFENKQNIPIDRFESTKEINPLEEIKTVDFDQHLEPPKKVESYIEFEGTDINKVVNRQKINKNRNSAVKSMILSQNYIPPLTISTEIDMSSILKLKHVLKKTHANIKFPSMAFIAKAISISLSEYSKLNSSYDPQTNEVVIKKYHNIGLATETSEGLVIPVLKFIEKLTIKEIAIDIKEMTQRLRKGEILNYETDGSTITIANYGNIGAIQASPTIFYPNAAVIGVGKVIKKPVVVLGEKLAIKAIMNMALTVDQRIIDAAEAGQFLSRVKEILEKPELLMIP